MPSARAACAMLPCAASIARDDRGALLLVQALGQRPRAVDDRAPRPPRHGAAAAGAGRRVNSRSAP
jgi:hypothetical protein